VLSETLESGRESDWYWDDFEQCGDGCGMRCGCGSSCKWSEAGTFRRYVHLRPVDVRFLPHGTACGRKLPGVMGVPLA